MQSVGDEDRIMKHEITDEQVDKVWAKVKEIEREHGWLTHINRETVKVVMVAIKGGKYV